MLQIFSYFYHLTAKQDGKFLVQGFRSSLLLARVSDLSQFTHPGLYDQDSKWIILATVSVLIQQEIQMLININ